MTALKTLVVTALLLPTLALASGYAVPDMTPRDLGMADSLVAAQRDAAATMKNPAALAKLEGINLSLAIAALNSDNSWVAPNNFATNSTLFRPTPPYAVYAAYGSTFKDHRWGVGLGSTVAFGGNQYWPNGWGNLPGFPSAGSYQVLTVDRRIYGIYLTGGVEILPWLRIGGGPIWYRTTEYLKQATSYQPISATPGIAEIGAAGDMFTYDVSAEVDIPKLPLTLGIDYKSQAVMTLKGNANFTNVPTILEPTLANQEATHPLTLPNQFNVGIAYRPLKEWLFTFTYTLDRWVVYKADVFTGTFGSPPLVITVPRHYANANLYRFGTEWQALPKLELRFGFHHDSSGYNAKTLSPSLPDAPNWVVAGGASWAFTPTLSLTGAYYHAFYATVTAQGPDAFPGSYTPRADILSLGVTWKL
ncbi:MAG TPA: outer membrane protein transport protein [Anaeromyxobacter sp.]|jgi:long-chain fatty acid transport protein|nr:outer membrane protein transport protein [Anaeromyxobacter sp.]